jgi:hypothetical protein
MSAAEMKRTALLFLLMSCAGVGVRAQDEATAAPEAAAPEATPAALDPEDQEPAAGGPPEGEQPSAELIITAEETVANEPGLSPGDEPLPQLEGDFPGEENIFGDDLFGAPDLYTSSMPEFPSAPPVIEDPREAERKMRVKFRKIRARLQGDPELLSLEDMAAQAPTPEDYRAARRSYYALFFAKIRQADQSLKDYADKLEKQSVAGLYQTRIQPTVALNPPPQPQPAAEFVPPNQYPDLLPADEQPIALP